MPSKPGRKKGSGKPPIDINQLLVISENPDEMFFKINELLYGHKYVSTRKNPRIAVNLELSWKLGEKEENAQSYTLSREGMFIKTPNPPEIDSEIEIKFLLPDDDEEFNFRAKVVHRVELKEAYEKGLISGMAVVFKEPDPDAQKKLDKFIAKKLSRYQ